VIKYLLLLAIVPLLLIPIFAQESSDNVDALSVTLQNDTPSIYQDSEGYTIVIGTVENHDSQKSISNVVIRVNFFDDFDSSPLEVVSGNTTLEVIPPNGQSPFAISSPSPNPDITYVSIFIIGFDSSEESLQPLTITTNNPTYTAGNTILISGEFNNTHNGTSLNISLQSPEGNYSIIPNIITNNDTYTTSITTGNNTYISTPGTYTITSHYGTNTASTTFDYYSHPVQSYNESFIPDEQYIILADHEIAKWTNTLQQWEHAQNRTDSNIERLYDKLDKAITRNQTDKIETYTQSIGHSMALSELYDGIIECLQQQIELLS